ncbi:competence type IV pilus major pilin ComGC [Sporosarcina sp. UB5]|uniref:competence type IV pilus major pilin ComGC n=1 Tax=Sporosarcina sp. UB5 TaxID=3047463 RepID=UPI003D7AB4D9
MKKWLQKRINNEKGLTLVELLAVIVILGIIAAIAVPSIGGVIDNTRIKAAKADAINAIEAAKLYFVDNDTDSVTLTVLKNEGYMKDLGTLEEGAGDGAGKVFKGLTGKDFNISATAKTTNGKIITFNNATIKEINESKNSDIVPVPNNS